jgi:hypothetical protein
VLEIQQKDVTWKGDFVPRHSHDVEGDLVEEHFLIKCPVCQAECDIKRVLPLQIQGVLRPL